jgi:hypothetical protein
MVLSARLTGKIRKITDEGLVSFARAFQYVGLRGSLVCMVVNLSGR